MTHEEPVRMRGPANRQSSLNSRNSPIRKKFKIKNWVTIEDFSSVGWTLPQAFYKVLCWALFQVLARILTQFRIFSEFWKFSEILKIFLLFSAKLLQMNEKNIKFTQFFEILLKNFIVNDYCGNRWNLQLPGADARPSNK